MDPQDRAAQSIEDYRGWAAAEDVHRLTGRNDKANTDFVNRYVLSKIGLRQEHDVVDVGCGDGSLLASVDCRRRIGVSPTEEERARLAGEHAGAGVDFRAGLVQDIPAESASADRVICNGVLSLLPSAAIAGQAIAELARIAKPGALVWIGEVMNFNDEARPSVLGSRKLGAWLYRSLSFDRAYVEYYKRERRRVVRGKQLVIAPHDLVEAAAQNGLALEWQGPHPYYRGGKRLFSPVRRNYLFSRRADES